MVPGHTMMEASIIWAVLDASAVGCLGVYVV